MQFSKTRRLRSRGRLLEEWKRGNTITTPYAPSQDPKALKTEQQLLDGKILQPSAYRPVEVS
jgi:hypothetical protein